MISTTIRVLNSLRISKAMIQCQISSNLIMDYITNVLHPTGTGLAFLNAFSRLLASSDEIKATKY